MTIQLAIGDPDRGDLNLWCEDRGFDEYGGQRFWVINGHWDGVIHEGKVYITDEFYPGCRSSTFPGKLIWRGCAPFADEDYNEAMGWLRDYLKRQPHLSDFFGKMKHNMKKISFNDAVEGQNTAKHNERVEALAGAYRELGPSIEAMRKRLAEAEAYQAEIVAAGENVEGLSDEDFSKLYNRRFGFQAGASIVMNTAQISSARRV